MTSPSYSILYSAVVHASASSGSAGDVMIQQSAGAAYVIASTANRGARRSTGLALGTYQANSVVEIQQTGQVDVTTAGLGAGTSSWVRVSSAGRLERCTPAVGDDIVGRVDTDGTFHASFGVLTAEMLGSQPLRGWYDPRDYGAVADYNTGTGTGTDNLAAFVACLADMKSDTTNGVAKMVVDGYYYLSDTLELHQTVFIQGTGMSEPTSGSGAQRSGPGAWLVWPTDVDGIIFHDQGDVLGGSDGSTMADINIYCSYQGRAGTFPAPADGHTGNGVVVTGQNIKLLRVNVQNFAENGFLVTAGNNSSYDVNANAGGFRLDGCIAGANGGCGYKVEGGDATVGNVINCGFTVNHGWGVSENTIGNTYVGIHCEGNRGFRPDIAANYSEYYVRSGVDNNGSVMIGCYAEGTISELDHTVQCIGGSLALKQNQIMQTLAQGRSSSIGSGNVVSGTPLSFEDTSGSVTTMTKFGSPPDESTKGIVWQYSTPALNADYTLFRYNDSNAWWTYENVVGRPFMRTPTTTARPRWTAPLFNNGYFFGDVEALGSTSSSQVLTSHTVSTSSPSTDAALAGKTYEVGDIVWNRSITATENVAWSCSTAGTVGTLVGVTGGITSGLTTLTLNDTTDILRWQYITIAGVSGIKQIVSDPNGSNEVEVDTAADATVVAAAVAWSPATLTPRGAETEYTVGPANSGAMYLTDGTADEVQINAAIVACNAAGGGVVRLLPGTFSVSTPVNRLSKVWIKGSGPRATTVVAAAGFASSGTNKWTIGCAGSLTTGTSIALASNADYGDTTITGTAGAELTAIAVDDFLFLMSDDLWETTNLSNRERGEFVQVVSTASPNITIYGMVRDDYLTASTAVLYRVSFVEGGGISDLSITQADTIDTRTGPIAPAIGMQMCHNAVVDNVEIYNWDGPGVTDYHSIGTRISSCYIHDLTDDSPNSRLGYGVLIGGASEGTIVSGNTMGRMRHAVDAGPSAAHANLTTIANNGIPRSVSVSNNVSRGCANVPFSTHSEAEGWSFDGNVASGSESIGFYMRGRSMSITGNTIQWCSGGIQIGNTGDYSSSGGSGSNSKVVGNTISHIKSITPGSSGTNFGGNGIVISATDNVSVTGNSISECDARGIYVRQYARRCHVTNNTIQNANLLNTANISAIGFEVNASGSTATLTYSAGTITVTGLASVASPAIGQSIIISGAATAANNGTFTIVSWVSATSVTYANASGATDANNGAISWIVECSVDNVFSCNSAVNTAASYYDRNTAGHAKYLAYDGGGSGNIRNVFRNNGALGMETAMVSFTGSNTYMGNVGALGIESAGSHKSIERKYVVAPITTTDGTLTTLHTISTSSGRNYYVTGYIQATTGGGGYWLYTIKGFYQNNAGVLTARIGAPVTADVESSAAADLTAAVSGTTVPIVATGLGATNITWAGMITVTELRA